MTIGANQNTLCRLVEDSLPLVAADGLLRDGKGFVVRVGMVKVVNL